MNKLDGIWNITVHTFIGDQFSTHTYLAEGDVLTGKVKDKGNGNETAILDGKIDGSKFSYQFELKIPIGKMKFTLEGEISEDGATIKGKSKNAMGKFDFSGTRAI